MAVLVTKPAPDFKAQAVLKDGSFAELSLSQFKGKYVLLFFYPLDFTFVCPTEIIAFSDRVKEFESLGVQVIGVSVDSHYSHLAWRNTPRNQGGIDPHDRPRQGLPCLLHPGGAERAHDPILFHRDHS